MSTSITCTLKEAADILKVHQETVSKLIASGDIPAARTGKQYMIMTRDVVKYAEKLIMQQTADRILKKHRPKSAHANLRAA